MNKINDDPLLTIFKNSSEEIYYSKIEHIENIPNFFKYITSETIEEDSKISVFENITKIIKKNRYISEYFSSYENKSIYLYLFELYLNKNSSEKLKLSIISLINELILSIETNKEIYEFIFQKISKIYNKEDSTEEKTKENLCNYLILLDVLLSFKEKIPKPRNYFALSGNNAKFSLDLVNKRLELGYCTSFILNFKIPNLNIKDEESKLISIKFSNKTSLEFKLKSPGFLLIKDQDSKENMIKALPLDEYMIILINIIFVENENGNIFQIYCFVNGENKLTSTNCKTNLDIKKDHIKSLCFFENFFGEVTSITMFVQKDETKPIINSPEFLPLFKNFTDGFHKKKYLKKFIDFISEEKNNNLINNLLFCFTPFTYFNPSWENDINKNNLIIDDVFGNYSLKIIDQDNIDNKNYNSLIRNHRYQYYQKKIYLVCDITNFLPIAELFMIYPHLLTETNFCLYLHIIENIINIRKRNVEAAKDSKFFDILFIFFEKYPFQAFTESILDKFIDIGKIMFKNNFSELTNTYFKHILLNEKILSKYDKNLQMKFWTQMHLFCESDYQQLENIIKMNRICLILRYYDKKKFKLMCCQKHLLYFKKEFYIGCEVMDPPMNTKLKDIWKIIDLIINSQEPNWVLSLFKLLLLDLSPCLMNFIIIAVTKALIRHNKKNKIKESGDLHSIKSIITVKKGYDWLDEFINQMINNKYESILINAFNHSLPDVRLNILKLMYQLYITLIALKKKEYTQIFFKFMKNYLLPQKMFYETIKGKEILILDDKIVIQYINDVILLLCFWASNKKLIETDDEINFIEKEEDINSIIKNCNLFEIILGLIKQTNYNLETIAYFFIRLQILMKNEFNCHKILYSYKTVLMLLDIIYECYKYNLKEKNLNAEMSLTLGIEIISDIYVNSVKYKARMDPLDKNYPFNEIELIFLWGNTIIFKINDIQKKIDEVRVIVFNFICQILSKILYKYKTFKKMELNEITEEMKDNSAKTCIEENYKILLYKLFEFSFEYVFDKLNLEIPPEQEITFYNSMFLTSMRINNSREKNIESYWDDYTFFKEIYSNISYIWNKNYIYKDFDIDALNKKNKVKKYKIILEKYILNKDKSNIFLNDIKFLCSYFIKENNYNNYFESSNKDEFLEISNFDDILKISFLKMIQIMLVCILTIIISKQNVDEFTKWFKEFKHFILFLIISSCNLVIKDKENKDAFNEYINYQDQILQVLYSCLYFLYQLRVISTICLDKINKISSNIFLFCFIILKYNYDFRKKYKTSNSKKFAFGYKYKSSDLSGSAIFILFNEYIKDGENILLTSEKIEDLIDENNYMENIFKFLEDKTFKENFYLNEDLRHILYEKYFPFLEYRKIVEKRLKTINRLNTENISNKWEFSDKDILDLLPSYEKELINYSNNSLEQRLIWKNFYKSVKKNIFSWNGYWSNRNLFFENRDLVNEFKSNDEIANKDNISKLKYKIMNHYTKSFMKPILVPILDMSYYLPDFTSFEPKDLFNDNPKIVVNIDIDKYNESKKLLIKRQETVVVNTNENYLRKIYMKSNPILAKKLSEISDSLDLGKEDEYSMLNQDDNNDDKKKEKEKKLYHLCCLVLPSHHIKGVCYITSQNINFKVFLNQKTGNAMTGINLGFTDKDDDYDINRKTCYGSFFMFHKKNKNLYKISIRYENIKFLLLKRYFYRNSAMEIFTCTNKSYYFNFKYEKDREAFINRLIKRLPKTKMIINDIKELKDNINIIGYSFGDNYFYKGKPGEKENNTILLSKIIKEWYKWRINNFSFLMYLNLFSNRSYNDLIQYPIFPWILSKYCSPINLESNYLNSSLYYEYLKLDNSNNNIDEEASINNDSDNFLGIEDKNKKIKNEKEIYDYRDMKLPMGMLELTEKGKKRKEEFIAKYKDMKENQEDHMEKPFYYGSNYSNAFFVCNFLMRLFPFAHISIELQGRLDDPNRLFLSVENSFENSVSLPGDVRELIPEFFYLPEMFLNINDLNLGKLENGTAVYNVNTPCRNNAYAFIELMNRILNGDKVSKIINNWVDLIFGYKAKGKEAENAKNIFSEKSYQENINLDEIEDKMNYLARAEYGLIPTQILNKECQKRKKKKELKKEKEITEFNILSDINKLKVVKIKHDSSAEKKIKNLDTNNIKNNLIKVDIFEEDKFMMLYENNLVIENKIGSSSDDIINVYKLTQFKNRINNIFINKINDKIIKFCNKGKTLIIGGFYDGKIEIIYLEEKEEIKKEELYPFSEEDPIVSIALSKDENYLFLGNTVGNLAIYKINWEKEEFALFKKIFNQKKAISDIDINLDLNIFATSSIDGNINLFTWPLCKLFRAIKTINDVNNKCLKIFLVETTLPSIIILIEKGNNNEFLSYSINGEFLLSKKENKNMSNIIKFKNMNSYEYLAFFTGNELKILNLPSLSEHLKLNLQNDFFNVKFIDINEDLNTIFGINEDGTQIQVIKT